MTEKHGILETLKNLAFEEEPEDHKPESSAAHIAPVSVPAPVISVPMTTSLAPDTDEAYQLLFAKTDFEGTDVGATIRKFLQPLSAIADTIMPPNIKFKTAVLQAKAQAGLTENSILASFDSLKAALEQEEQTFETKAQQFAAREINGRQDRIGKISSQITKLQQELAQLSTELLEAQGKASRAEAQFKAAVQRRSTEIEQQKAQYAALLKG